MRRWKPLKSVFERLRLSGERGDGAPLIDAVLALGRSGQPVMALTVSTHTLIATNRRALRT
jgi:hypothetical protein